MRVKKMERWISGEKEEKKGGERKVWNKESRINETQERNTKTKGESDY